MKLSLLCLLVLVPLIVSARPVAIPGVKELHVRAECVLVIAPVSTRKTTDVPDDGSFGTRPLTQYQALETTCRVESVFKGRVESEEVKIVHFAFSSAKAEFNGGLFIVFLLPPAGLVVYPAAVPPAAPRPDLALSIPYAQGPPLYLAFLRRLPDGRFAPAAPHYDAATAFRLLTTPLQSQSYIEHPAAQVPSPAGK